MLASPSLPFGLIEDTIVVCVHPLELGRCPSRRALLGPLDVLLSREFAGRRLCGPRGSRAWRSRRLLICLG
jgi:hypothetical protein